MTVAAVVTVIVICFAISICIGLCRFTEWLLSLAAGRGADYEQAVTEALATANHPAARAIAERLFTEEDAAWLEQEGISR